MGTMKMNEGTSVNDFIRGVKDVVTKLASVGEVIRTDKVVQPSGNVGSNS